MKAIRFSLAIGLMIIILSAFPRQSEAMSRETSDWTQDKRIPGYLDDTTTPFLIADQDRTVHAFASQWVGDGTSRRRGIFYRQWTLASDWTRPVNILLSPAGGDAIVVGAFLSSDGVFHLIFWGNSKQGGNIFYTNAIASDAGNALAWSTPELIGEGAVNPSYGTIDGDNQGNLIIVYNGSTDGNGVYIIQSSDAGRSWSKSTPLFLTNDPRRMPYTIKSYIGESGKLHLVWGVNVMEGGVYDSLYYANVDFKTGNWSEPVLLDKRPDIERYFGPSVPSIVDNGKYIVIFYNGGNPYTGGIVPLGRPTLLARLSDDGGESWGNIINPIPFLIGQSGEQALVVDSNHVVHAIANMRIDVLVDGKPQPVYGVWHTEFHDGVWRYPQRFVTTIAPVNIRAVVSQGNVILATWNEDSGEGSDGVWYSYTILDSPESPVTPLPSSPPLEKPAMANTAAAITEIPGTPTSISLNLLNKENTPIENPQLPILIGIVPAMAFIAAILLRATLVRRK